MLTYVQNPKDKTLMYFGRIFENRTEFPTDAKGCKDLTVTHAI